MTLASAGLIENTKNAASVLKMNAEVELNSTDTIP